MSTCQGRGELGAWGTGMGTGMGRHCVMLADLPGSQCHFGVLGLAELCQLMEDGRQLICQRGVTATQLVLQCHSHHGSAQAPCCVGWLHPKPQPHRGWLHPAPSAPLQPKGTRPKALKWALFDPSVVTQHHRGEIIKVITRQELTLQMPWLFPAISLCSWSLRHRLYSQLT